MENFVKFQHVFEGKGAKPKIIPLGCVPSNRVDGEVLKVGGRFSGTDFVYACEESEDGVMSYDAVACVDALGKEMMLGEMRKLSNGTVILHCNIYGGALKKVVERAAGCYFNETIYNEDQLWIEPLISEKRMRKNKKLRKMPSTMNTTELTGRMMECFRPHHSYYESHVIGCAIGRVGVRFDEFVELQGGSYAQCEQDDSGNVKLQPVQLEDLSCMMGNQTYSHLSKWTDDTRGAEMTCRYGTLQKTGCLVDGRPFVIGQELRLSNGCTFMCHPQSNVYVCDEKLGNWTIDENQVQRSPAVIKFKTAL